MPRTPACPRRPSRHSGCWVYALGQGIDDVAVALLTGTRINEAGRLLREIHRVGLAEKHDGRFSLHDLVHGFAVTLAPHRDSEPGRAALSRMVAGYYWCVNYEFSLRNDNNPMVDADFLYGHASLAPGGTEAVENTADWFATERANLIDLTVRSCRARPPLEMGPGLAFSLFYSLEAGGYWADWDMVNKDGLGASRELGDALNLARLTRNTGRLEFVKVRDRAEALHADPAGNQEQQHAVRAQCLQAIAALEDSISLYSQCTPEPTAAVVTSRREIADVHLELARHDPGESSRAIDGYREAWEQYEELPRPANPIASLKVSLSAAYRIAGQYKEAEACLEQALDYAEQLNENGDPKHARIIGYGCLRRAELEEALGAAHLEAAAAWYAKAAGRFRQDKNLLAEARALARQGRLLARLSRPSQARDMMNCAVKIMHENHPDEAACIQSWIDELPAAAAG